MRISHKLGCIFSTLLAVAIVGLAASPATACGGFFRGRRQACGQGYGYARVAYAPVPCYQPAPQPYPTPAPVVPTSAPAPTPAPVPKPTPSPQTSQVEQGDPYGFVVWLNYQRSIRGLRAVAWDNTCYYHAYQNNLHQQARGMGHHHHVMRRQNAGAMGAGEPTWIAWVGSPGHADALFDPSITVVGLHVLGQYQTFNAN